MKVQIGCRHSEVINGLESGPFLDLWLKYQEENNQERRKILALLIGACRGREQWHINQAASKMIRLAAVFSPNDYDLTVEVLTPLIVTADFSDAELTEIIKDLDSHDPVFVRRYLKKHYPDLDPYKNAELILEKLGY